MDKNNNDVNQQQKDLLSLTKDMREIDHLEEKIDGLRQDIDKRCDTIDNKIEVVNESINSKLDEIDVAFRGNSKIGLFEQLRGVRRHVAIIWCVVIVLLGLKLFGTNLSSWWIDFKKEYFVQEVQPVSK